MVEPLLTARHVVVAIDGSDDSKMAVLWAARNVLKPDDALHLVTASACLVVSMEINKRSIHCVHGVESMIEC